MARKKADQEEAREGCFGTYSDDDDNCNDECPDYDDCIERTEEIESDLADLDDDDSDDDDSDEDETEDVDDPEEEQEEEFDPSSVDLSDPATRIDALADLELNELLVVAKFHKIKITGDARKDDNEVMILIDDHFDNLPDDEPEEEEEEPKPKPRRRKKKSEPEPEDESEEEPPEIDEEPEEEEKPKPRRRRKKKIDPEPEIQEDFVDEEKDPSEESLTVASDAIMETVEILLDRSDRYLVKYGDVDHLKGVRNKLNEIIAARSKSIDLADDQSEEVKEPEPESEEGLEEEEEAPEPEYPDIPEYFAEIADSVGAKVFVKGDKVSMKKGPTVLAMLVIYKGAWQVLFSQGKLDKLPGTKPYKPYKNYPAIPAALAPRASKLLSFHVKTRIRGMKKKKPIVR